MPGIMPGRWVLPLVLLGALASSEQLAGEPSEELNSEPAADDKTCACGNSNRPSTADGPSTADKALQPKPEENLSEAAMRHNEEMVEIPPGSFFMGTPKEKVHFKMDGEGPVRRVRMSGFALDRYEVSNQKFADFVAQTDYTTEAERFGDSFVAELWLSPAVSATIDKAVAVVPWWLPVNKADWRHPEGFDSDIEAGDRMSHPVIHVSWNDAAAYCRWRNSSLPTEAQWEYASRGDKHQKMYPWGNAMQPIKAAERQYRMNIWQGKFPTLNTAEDGYNTTAPVDSFGPQNTHGLHNMVGNVWEWTADWWTPAHYLTEENQHLGFIDPVGPNIDELEQLKEMGYLDKESEYEKTKKGGSFMCHKSYCWRYRVCARTKMTPDSSAHNVGFRCAGPPTNSTAAHWSNVPEHEPEQEAPPSLQTPDLDV